MKNCAIIFAPESGDSFCSKKPKAMQKVLFKPMLDWVLSAVRASGIEDICVITKNGDTQIAEHVGDSAVTVTFGDTDAIGNFAAAHDGCALMLSGSKPFLDAETLMQAMRFHEKENCDVTVIASEVAEAGHCCKASALSQLLEENKNGKGCPIDRLKESGKVSVFRSENDRIALTADTKEELNRLTEIARTAVLDRLTAEGVDIPCRDGVMIGPDCVIGRDTEILPGTILRGKVVIGEDCVIGPNSFAENAEIGDGVSFNNGQIRNAKILNDADIGPFVQVRPDSVIGESVHLGNFVEVKNSVIDTGTKVSHLTYVGDSDVGKGVNFGCGVVTVNYTGKSKHRTTIKDGAFIGCNTNLVAPVTVGEYAYTAAGSTITQDVPDKSLAIARERQTNKEDWVERTQPYKKKV